jgi:hypothetical protein
MARAARRGSSVSGKSPMTQNLPSLTAFIGDGGRGEGFQEWVAHMTARACDFPPSSDEAAVARLLKILCIATVEGMRIELQHFDRPFERSIPFFARMMGVCCAAAVLSCGDEDLPKPYAEVIPLLADEFALGLRLMDVPK